METEQEIIEVFHDHTLKTTLKAIIGEDAFLPVMHGIFPDHGKYSIMLMPIHDMMENDAKKDVGCIAIKHLLKKSGAVACCLVTEIWMTVHSYDKTKTPEEIYDEAGPPRLSPDKKDMLLFHFETKKGQNQKLYDLQRDKDNKVIKVVPFKVPEGQQLLKGRMTNWLEKDLSGVN